MIRARSMTVLLIPGLGLFLTIMWLRQGSSGTYMPRYPHDAPYPPPIPVLDHAKLDLPLLPSSYEPYFPAGEMPAMFDNPLYRPLAHRLHTWLSRPVLSFDEARAANERQCPRRIADPLVNPDQYNGEHEFWENLSIEEIVQRRAEIVLALQRKLEAGEEVLGGIGSGQGRGIVLTGGNGDTTQRTISIIRHLRRLDVQLPIEVFHYRDELQDVSERQTIESLGATVREIRGVWKQEGAWKNWQIKGLALVQSAFQEILYLDSDNTPLRDPSHLFESELYLSRGRAAFWPDMNKDHPSNAIWRIVGEECSFDEWSFESGQIVIDKSGNEGLNLVALQIAAEMQSQREFWFHMCGGDKDTFRWAFRILDIPYAVSPRWMSSLGIRNGYEGGRFCGHTILQYDLDIPEGFTREPPLFVHSNLLKHINGWDLQTLGTFTHVKHFTNDAATNPLLNYVHAYAYNGIVYGLCVDIESPPMAQEDLGDDQLDGLKIEMTRVNDLEGNPFEGFESAFFEEGGRVGGW